MAPTEAREMRSIQGHSHRKILPLIGRTAGAPLP
jgi:hypothetical protein